MVECQTVDLEVPGSNPSWGEFFSLKFLLMRKWTKWRTTTTRTTQVIPWSLADGHRQKWGTNDSFAWLTSDVLSMTSWTRNIGNRNKNWFENETKIEFCRKRKYFRWKIWINEKIKLFLNWSTVELSGIICAFHSEVPGSNANAPYFSHSFEHCVLRY